MPRGQQAKATRYHNRAMLRGNSCSGSSSTASNQRGGKKYRKGETKSHINFQMIKTIYEGVYYEITYKFDELNIEVENILENMDKVGDRRGVDNVREKYIKMSEELKIKIIVNAMEDILNQAVRFNMLTIKNYMILCNQYDIYPNKENLEYHIKKFVK
tara:strand:- start:1286 stop:1759 length:474 start_codon:yes stop_codon:yes gene_type:complete